MEKKKKSLSLFVSTYSCTNAEERMPHVSTNSRGTAASISVRQNSVARGNTLHLNTRRPRSSGHGPLDDFPSARCKIPLPIEMKRLAQCREMGNFIRGKTEGEGEFELCRIMSSFIMWSRSSVIFLLFYEILRFRDGPWGRDVQAYLSEYGLLEYKFPNALVNAWMNNKYIGEWSALVGSILLLHDERLKFIMNILEILNLDLTVNCHLIVHLVPASRHDNFHRICLQGYQCL